MTYAEKLAAQKAANPKGSVQAESDALHAWMRANPGVDPQLAWYGSDAQFRQYESFLRKEVAAQGVYHTGESLDDIVKDAQAQAEGAKNNTRALTLGIAVAGVLYFLVRR